MAACCTALPWGGCCEQENVDWLKEIAAAGHPVGNHTYDHVNVTATKAEDIQFRFQAAPWLIEGRPTGRGDPREHSLVHARRSKSRVGVEPAGFRTPGGFATGLKDRPDLQQMLLELGFSWVSSLYPPHPVAEPRAPSEARVGRHRGRATAGRSRLPIRAG